MGHISQWRSRSRGTGFSREEAGKYAEFYMTYANAFPTKTVHINPGNQSTLLRPTAPWRVVETYQPCSDTFFINHKARHVTQIQLLAKLSQSVL